MWIYQNSYRKDVDSHLGYEYFGSMRAARKAAREAARENSDDESYLVETTLFEYPKTKKGMLAALNRFGKHPDNG